MSDIGTSTPNGDGNRNLYDGSETNFEIVYMALKERDPEKEANTGDAPGSNTSVQPVEIGRTDPAEIKIGYVGIPVTIPPTPEKYAAAKKAIRERAQASAERSEGNKEDKENEGK